MRSVRLGREVAGSATSAALTVAILVAGCVTPKIPPSTLPFLGPKDFAGTYTPGASNTAQGGQATYSGYIVFTNIDRSTVAAALPSDLKLATNLSPTPDLHPIIFLYGHQRNTHWIIGGTTPQVGQDYTELTVLIPFVQNLDGTRWHNYVARMYLDDLGAIYVGNLFYAYAKEWGKSDESGTAFTECHDAQEYFGAAMQESGGWLPSAQAETALLNYQAIETIFEMPMVGWNDYSFTCSYFDFNYDKALVQTLKSQHTFGAACRRASSQAVPVEIVTATVP